MKLILPILLSLVPTAAAQTVWTVGPAAPHTEISSAVEVAQDGDLIRVQPGSYEHFGVFGKSLTIMGNGPGVRVLGHVRVQFLETTDSVVLARLEVDSPEDYGLTVAECEGAVRVQDCIVEGGAFATGTSHGEDTSTSYTGLRVLASGNVVLRGCSIAPGTASALFASNGDYVDITDPTAALVVDSTLALEACTLRGGNGGGTFLFGSEGSPGMHVADSFLTLRNCDIHGGRGGNSEDNGFNGCGTPGTGGAAIRAWSTTVVSQSNQLTGGEGGRVLGFNCNLTGAPGLPFVGHGAQLTELPGTAPRLSAPSLVREGDPVQFTFEGDPGSRVDLIVGLGDAFLYLPALSGNLLVAPPFLRDRFIAGVIPASGALDWTLNAPGVPALTWAGLRFQSGHYDPVTSSIKLGPVHVLGIVDGAW